VQSSINLANSVIGIGNLGFPYLFKMFGVFLTVIFFIVAYWLMYMSCRLLLEARNWSKKQDFSKISVYCFGRLGLISHFAIWLNNFAMCLAFLVVYGNGLDTVFSKGLHIDNSSFLYSKILQFGFAALMVLPFLFIRSTKGLQFVSGITFISHCSFALVKDFYLIC